MKIYIFNCLKGFETGSVRKFVMTTQYWLGHLTYLHIWHDNSGEGTLKSWYLHKIQVDDLQMNERLVSISYNIKNYLSLLVFLFSS